MRIQAFESLLKSDTRALRYLRKKRYKNGRVFCRSCSCRAVYRLAEGRYRCSGCRYTFGLFTGTWFGQVRIKLRTWLWLIKLFELELTARQAAAHLGLSYPTVLRAFTLIRQAILAQEQPQLMRSEVELDESYFGGRRKGRRGRGAANLNQTPNPTGWWFGSRGCPGRKGSLAAGARCPSGRAGDRGRYGQPKAGCCRAFSRGF